MLHGLTEIPCICEIKTKKLALKFKPESPLQPTIDYANSLMI